MLDMSHVYIYIGRLCEAAGEEGHVQEGRVCPSQ